MRPQSIDSRLFNVNIRSNDNSELIIIKKKNKKKKLIINKKKKIKYISRHDVAGAPKADPQSREVSE